MSRGYAPPWLRSWSRAFALCFVIFADEVVLLIFLLQNFPEVTHHYILFAPLVFHVKQFEASTLLWVVKGILLDIRRNM